LVWLELVGQFRRTVVTQGEGGRRFSLRVLLFRSSWRELQLRLELHQGPSVQEPSLVTQQNNKELVSQSFHSSSIHIRPYLEKSSNIARFTDSVYIQPSEYFLINFEILLDSHLADINPNPARIQG
jgi:hypothetical protein